MEKKSEVNRNCGIEMLKIISIFLIIISHVVMTIRLKNQFVSYDDYIFGPIGQNVLIETAFSP